MKLKTLQTTGLIYSILIAIIAFISLEFEQLELIGNPSVMYEEYSDQDEGGNSVSKILSTDPLSYNYTINEGLKFPYAGVYFSDTLEKGLLDLSKFDQIEIEISAAKGKLIPLTIYTLWNLKSRPFQKVIKTNTEITTYNFSLKDFKTSEWWLAKYKVAEDENQSFHEVLSINIEASHEVLKGVQDEVTINRVLIYKNNTPYILGLFIAWCLGLFTIFLIPFFKPQKEYIPIKAIEFEKGNQNNGIDAIIAFIGDEYSNPELTVRAVSKATNLKESEISKYLKEKFSKNFKEYLNFVRITEAKRLLKESELQVSEIAYTVGYNNVTHFNRVFKAAENISPNEFRA